MRSFILKHPVVFTLIWLIVGFILADIMTVFVGKKEYSIFLLSIITIGVAFSLRENKQLLLTSKVRSSKLKYYIFPILHIAAIPLVITGGYYFDFITKEKIAMMAGVGIFEELLTHSICMGLLLMIWGTDKKSVMKAAVFSSVLFGLFHLIAILQDPTNTNLILWKSTTVIFATFIGIGYAALAHVTNTIWIVAFLHALLDIVFFIGTEEKLNRIYTEWDITMSVIHIAYFIPLALYGLWMIKREVD